MLMYTIVVHKCGLEHESMISFVDLMLKMARIIKENLCKKTDYFVQQ